MVVCDICKKIGVQAFTCAILLTKEEAKAGKDRTRIVKELPVHLCEKCITNAIGRIGRMISLWQSQTGSEPETTDAAPQYEGTVPRN